MGIYDDLEQWIDDNDNPPEQKTRQVSWYRKPQSPNALRHQDFQRLSPESSTRIIQAIIDGKVDLLR